MKEHDFQTRLNNPEGPHDICLAACLTIVGTVNGSTENGTFTVTGWVSTDGKFTKLSLKNGDWLYILPPEEREFPRSTGWQTATIELPAFEVTGEFEQGVVRKMYGMEGDKRPWFPMAAATKLIFRLECAPAAIGIRTRVKAVRPFAFRLVRVLNGQPVTLLTGCIR